VEINPEMEEVIRERLVECPDLYTLIIKPSVEAAKDFPNFFFDFVYIDADHTYKAVMEDLTAWYPKVKIGGVICGHDFIQMSPDEPGFDELNRAVVHFFSRNNIELNVEDIDWWGIKCQ
jgi:hypothetical protein